MDSDEVKQLVRSLGADLVGVAHSPRLEGVPGYNPSSLLPNAQSVIVAGMRLLKGSLAKGRGRPVAWVTIHLNLKLNEIAYEIAKYLEDRGHNAFPVFFLPMTFIPPEDEESKMSILTTPNFSYVPAAIEAGLGERGLNHLLVTPKYGPRVRLVSVITDVALAPDKIQTEKLCPGLECGLCIDACPPKCLSREREPDFVLCNKHHNAYLHLLGYGSCAMCMHVCPIGA
jgi:O-acetylhomoserine (thiol)-lyase